MLVAPLALPERSLSRRRGAPTRRTLLAGSRRRDEAAALSARPTVLCVWLAIGLGVLLCIPAARGDALLGATLPFWLVAAPLLDLAWVKRAGLLDTVRRRLRLTRMRRRATGAVHVSAKRKGTRH
ncbi:hypothetical protein [Dokdonella soli]|uniref:Uncharacterized protein n=1 Tax=Dokdonella soli TaxID=529810 RepID=A0ABP3TKF0_9GAMM